MAREIRSFVYGREYIPASLAESSTCRLLIVTDDQIEVLRNLVNYAHQRRSWNDETIDDERYYMPSDEDWDDIEALVSDLEDKLMSDCDFVTLDDANDRLGIKNPTPTATLDVLGDVRIVAPAAAVSTDVGLFYQRTYNHVTGQANSNYNLSSLTLPNNTVANTILCGFLSITQKAGAGNVTHASAYVAGASFNARNYGTGSITSMWGMESAIYSTTNAGVVTNAACIRAIATLLAGSAMTNLLMIRVNSPSNAGTITNLYGLYIEAMTAGGSNYAIYTNAGAVRIGGEFGCNAATPQAAAAVNAASTDLPTVIALLNQIRAALVANGICV